MNNLNVFKDEMYPWRPCNWFHNIKRFFKCIKYCGQRITKGYCDSDLWNLDIYYANLFENTLKDFADRCAGYPGRGEFADPDGYDKWVNYIKEMSNHFHEYNKDFENPYEDLAFADFDFDKKNEDVVWQKYLQAERENYDYKQEQLKLGLEKVARHWNELWD